MVWGSSENIMGLELWLEWKEGWWFWQGWNWKHHFLENIVMVRMRSAIRRLMILDENCDGPIVQGFWKQFGDGEKKADGWQLWRFQLFDLIVQIFNCWSAFNKVSPTYTISRRSQSNENSFYDSSSNTLSSCLVRSEQL